MSVTLEELSGFVNRNAVIHLRQEDGSLRETTAKIVACSSVGVVIRERSRSQNELLEVAAFEEIAPAPSKEKRILQKVLKPIEEGHVRQHLVDRHGVGLDWARSATEAEAFQYHESLDHSNLGHTHKASEPETVSPTPASE